MAPKNSCDKWWMDVPVLNLAAQVASYCGISLRQRVERFRTDPIDRREVERDVFRLMHRVILPLGCGLVLFFVGIFAHWNLVVVVLSGLLGFLALAAVAAGIAVLLAIDYHDKMLSRIHHP